MLKDKIFGIISLGCDKNRVDSEKLIAYMREQGYTFSFDINNVQILIINTCGFLNSAREESIDTIFEYAEYKKQKLEKIVVTGCFAQKFIDELYDELTEVDVFLGVRDYSALIPALEKSYAEDSRENFVNKGNDKFYGKRTLTTLRHYGYLKISDGCYHHCTYCLIPKIRGKYVSYPMEDLIEEAKNLGELSELIIVAQDTTRYGEDLYGENKFVELLQKLSLLDNIKNIRLLYCYPDAIDDKLINEIKTNDKIIKYIDIPLQHSEDRILKLMNRKGTRESYINLIKKLRDNIPNIAIRSTFITGFPTETEEEYENMKKFLKEVKLTNCGFFEYSCEPDTAAAKMEPQIDDYTKKLRARGLYRVQKNIYYDYISKFVGKKLKVMYDDISRKKCTYYGRPYFSAPEIDGVVYFCTKKKIIPGRVYTVKIRCAENYDLYGDVEED